MRGRRTEHVHRWLAQALGPLGARHHERSCTVGHEAAVERVQRRHLVGRADHVVDGEGVAVSSLGVHRRPSPRLHRDRSELLRRRAVLVHVPVRGECVRGDRCAEAVGHFELDGRVVATTAARTARSSFARRPLAIGAGSARVDAHDDVAQARGDRCGRVLGVHLERRPTGHRRLRPSGDDPQVLGQHHRRLGVAHPVDVLDRKAGVVEGRLDHRDLERTSVQLELARGRREVGNSDDRSLPAQLLVH